MSKQLKLPGKKDVGNKSKVKCWEVFRCEKKTCPAYKSGNPKCWLITGTHCRDEIQGKFLDKIGMCLDCRIFKNSVDVNSMRETYEVFNDQLKQYRTIVEERDRELEHVGRELALGLSEVFEALKKISAGDPAVRISEKSEFELIEKLKHLVNITAENIGEIVDLSHEFAISLAELFDVFHRVSLGDLNARVTGLSRIELLESLKNITNETIESISKEMEERRAAEDALRESEGKYKDFYQKAPDGYQSCGPDGIILEVNDTWLEMFGYKRFEVEGKMRMTDLLTGEGMEIFQKKFQDLKYEGAFENLELEIRKSDGTLLPVLLNSTAVYDESGNFSKSRTIIRDNTTKRNYEKILLDAAKQWRSTFDSMPYGVMVLDRNFKVVRVNEYISTLIGRPIKEIIGMNLQDLIRSEDIHSMLSQMTRMEDASRSETFEHYISDSKKFFMVSATPIANHRGLIMNYILSLVDITENKEKEKRLIQSRDAFLNMLKEIDFSYKELKELYNGLILSFVNAIDAKSPWTKGHSERVTHHAISIAQEMALKEKDIETLRIASLLHDIGKIGTYDIILDKPGRLSEEEFKLIKMHPEKGVEILRPIRQLQHILPIIRHHHERMDGDGYPDGLRAEEIPILSRIISIADSYDSMTSDRPYRPSPPREYAIEEIKRCIGTQFDPQVAEAFLKILEKERKSRQTVCVFSQNNPR
ncbi:MAG: HD domain-containing phosphohydrolase [Nitrospirota bacterium]